MFLCLGLPFVAGRFDALVNSHVQLILYHANVLISALTSALTTNVKLFLSLYLNKKPFHIDMFSKRCTSNKHNHETDVTLCTVHLLVLCTLNSLYASNKIAPGAIEPILKISSTTAVNRINNNV